MRTVAIILGDNDFGSTFGNLLETLKRVVVYRAQAPEEWLTKAMGCSPYALTPDDVRYMILQMALAHYLAFSYSFKPSDYELRSEISGRDVSLIAHEQHLNSIREYFLKNLRILFDEEAEQDIAEGDHDGGAWYLELQSGTIKSY